MIRQAEERDLAAIVGLVRELAAFERAPDDVELTVELARRALFSTTPRAAADVWEEHGEVVAVAVWYRTFSTWTGRHGIWLEDLYVQPAHRRKGIAGALIAHLAARCIAEGGARLEWSVLDWNEPALAFYERVGARPLEEWTIHRLMGEALERAAEGPFGPPEARSGAAKA